MYFYYAALFLNEFTTSMLLVLVDHSSAVTPAKGYIPLDFCMLYSLSIMIFMHCLRFNDGGFGNPLVKLAYVIQGSLSAEMFIVLSTAEVLGGFVGHYLVSLDAVGMVETFTTNKLTSTGEVACTQMSTAVCTAMVIMCWCLYIECRPHFEQNWSWHFLFLSTVYAFYEKGKLGEFTNPVRLIAKSVFTNKFDNLVLIITGQMIGFIVTMMPCLSVIFWREIDVFALMRGAGDRQHRFGHID